MILLFLNLLSLHRSFAEQEFIDKKKSACFLIKSPNFTECTKDKKPATAGCWSAYVLVFGDTIEEWAYNPLFLVYYKVNNVVIRVVVTTKILSCTKAN